MQTTGQKTQTFGQIVKGARGTIQWANGFGTTRVEVVGIGHDCIVVDHWDKEDTRMVVPCSAILYFTFAGEDD